MAELAIVIDPRDSIAVAVAELEEGQRCPVRVGKTVHEVEIKEKIPFGHKFALGAIPKGTDVLKYGEIYARPGLYLMDAPGQDAQSTTGMVAGGCQIVLFTTGRGTPTGHPLAPVIKITGNSASYRKMMDNIDINVGTVIDGAKTLEEAGREIFQAVLATADGRPTKAEILGHDELMTVWRPSSEHGLAYGCGDWA